MNYSATARLTCLLKESANNPSILPPGVGPDVHTVLVENGELRDALAVAVELLDRLADNDGCEYDHNDDCQMHNLHQRPCPHPLARQIVAAWRKVELERIERVSALDDDLDEVANPC
ncbi:hypothetical protein Caci_2932 [Catenulispora acidiphila DSM 44928]|uniref:Uncharacterized protein n=1 Tax=Catenulispora acidiphila (strain DSM 44928 / JCM 14897 / NBRC 102108 / NRRL B-24433 / ID139908) TaxID=479433 RepID=C7Q2U9_CATAD|nr:hypothetical protein [Catenulispora acidiphila]ACU71841.1 hypothetical protein Caci_2932 [Catenulispora acidiphila DSM 44928]